MFLESLSESLLQIIDARRLTYEMAASLCDMSARHLKNIVGKRTSPTITKFENFCIGFDTTPNELLKVPSRDPALAYRIPMQVSIIYCYQESAHRGGRANCPRCRGEVEKRFQAYCCHCGQHLAWERFN